DTLGVDQNALYIGANVFDMSGNFVSSSAYVIRKTSVLGSGPVVYTKFANIGNVNGGLFAPMGVDDFDTNPSAGYIVGVDASTPDQLDVLRITTPGGTPSILSPIQVPTLAT